MDKILMKSGLTLYAFSHFSVVNGMDTCEVRPF